VVAKTLQLLLYSVLLSTSLSSLEIQLSLHVTVLTLLKLGYVERHQISTGDISYSPHDCIADEWEFKDNNLKCMSFLLSSLKVINKKLSTYSRNYVLIMIIGLIMCR
jgi:hypothetical protein